MDILKNTLFVTGPTIYGSEAVRQVESRVAWAVAELGIRTEAIRIGNKDMPFLIDCPYGPCLDMYENRYLASLRNAITASRGIVVANEVTHHHDGGMLQNAVGQTVASLIDRPANRGKVFLTREIPLVSGISPPYEHWDDTRDLLRGLEAVELHGDYKKLHHHFKPRIRPMIHSI